MNLKDIVFIRDNGHHKTNGGHPLMKYGRFAFGIDRSLFELLKELGAFNPKINRSISADWFVVTPKAGATIYSDDYREICRWIYGYDQKTARNLQAAKSHLAVKLWPEITMKIYGEIKEIDYSDGKVSSEVFSHPEYQKLHDEYLRVHADRYEGEELLKKLREVSNVRIEDPNNISVDRVIFDDFPLLLSDYLIEEFKDLPPGEFVISEYDISPVY